MVQPSPQVVRIVIVLWQHAVWHLILLAPRDHLGGLGSQKARSARNEGHSPTQYEHSEGSEGLESHVRRSEIVFFPRRLLISAVQPPTSRVVRGRQTWPSASRVRPGSVWSDWARWDRQRTIFMDPSPAAQPGLSRASSSKSSRARQPVNPQAAVLYQRTDRRTLYWTRKFSEVRSGTLGSEIAREGPT